ncbi:MAG: Gldg family protein [Lachnospiraceae bacterium]|nr:Gldg family protein [Lachnospiraceae bacterium]
MIAIYKREFMSFFHSFIGWLFLAATLLMTGVYFTAYNMFYGDPNISGVLASIMFLFVIAIPILTMGILAEDRKHKTDQLILTAPVTVGKIVLGKYLALLTVFAIPAIVIGFTPIVLSFFGTFQMGVSYTALLGFFLYGALALAIGLFISSLTESNIIAAILTFVALFLGYMMSGICSIISQTGNILTKILSAFDMFGRFEEMLSGNLYLPSVVYYITITAFMLICTVQSIQKRRYTASGKGIKLGKYSLGLVIVSLILTALVNTLIYKLPANMLSYDVTSNKLFTTTEYTQKYVSDLEDDVTIYVLENEDNKDRNLDKMLQKIGNLSEHITIIYVDPTANPLFYTNYSDTSPSRNSLIVVGPERSRIVDYENIYTYEFDYMAYQYQITGYDGEGQIVSSLAYVTTDDMPKIYVIAGHSELELEAKFIDAIQKENIEYENLSLLAVSEIPEDAKTIIINAPITDFSSDDADKVIAYLEAGGNAIIIPTWSDEEMPNFERILEYYGVSLADGMIVEGDMGMYYNEDPFMLFPQIDYDEITDSVYDAVVFVPYAQGLYYDDEAEDIYYQPLLETSDSSYSKAYSDMEINTGFYKSEGDIDGPFVIAMKAEKIIGNDVVSKVVFAASENMFSEAADSVVPGNNVKLFSSILSSLVEHESSVSIPVKYYDAAALIFSTRDIVVVGIISILVIPICCLVIGFVIWLSRRKR